METKTVQELIDLADYRRKVQAVYAGVRDRRIPMEQRWNYWVAARDQLFASHPQSPLSAQQSTSFQSLAYYPYNPAWRWLLELHPANDEEVLEVELSADGVLRLQRAGFVDVPNQVGRLTVFRLLGYGGGLFLPFRDPGAENYPGSRYLFDTIKGADLGSEGNKLVVDFNFAYNPSCAYNPHWDCPLAPAENWLQTAIHVGEKAYPGASA